MELEEVMGENVCGAVGRWLTPAAGRSRTGGSGLGLAVQA